MVGGVNSKLKCSFFPRCIYCSCQAYSIWYLWWSTEGSQCNRLGWTCSQSCPRCRGCGPRACKQHHHGKCHAGTDHTYNTERIHYKWSDYYILHFVSDPFPYVQSSADAPYIARHVGLRCGVPIPVPALTVNRLCGSGFQSIINGAQVSTKLTKINLSDP